MKKLFFLGGIALCFISILVAFTNKDKIELFKTGENIVVRVVDIPLPCHLRSRKIRPYFKFEYQNKVYSKNLKDHYCDSLRIGDTIRLKTNKERSLFVFTDEKLFSNFYACGALFLLGGFITCKGANRN